MGSRQLLATPQSGVPVRPEDGSLAGWVVVVVGLGSRFEGFDRWCSLNLSHKITPPVFVQFADVQLL